ncbi:hypothetical protein Tsp_04941 [Trichinella spiralis]|uniref:Uncharacterized protein n=1 Tax=Trichinella spiralis TaxID=6334 RepID=E5SWK0_TRISP|nr:hypothetical protein Tsp_04941 [Trichinella spiralis]KRY30857.1 hypothetical protein T01_15282 [Trichinella spiralis]
MLPAAERAAPSGAHLQRGRCRLMRSPYVHSGHAGFFEGVCCSDFTADDFVSSFFDLESSPTCHWANSRKFCKFSSSSVASGLMFVSQAVINPGGNLSCNIDIRPSLKGRRPENGSLSSAVKQRKCFVTSSTSDCMPRAVISRHAGALHRAARCSRIISLGRPKKVDRLDVVFWSERNSFDGVPRRPLGAGQQVGEFGGVVQVTPFVNVGLELGPKEREFQYLPSKLREGHLRQPVNYWPGPPACQH